MTATLQRGSKQDAVVLVHGIKSRGVWYAYFERVLEPHYYCVRADYTEYRSPFVAAVLVLISEGFLPLVLLPALSLGTIAGTVCSAWPGVLTAAGLSIATILGRLAIRHTCREPALAKVGAAIQRAGAVEPAAHVVAHSFGTFLIGTLIRRPQQRLNRVVFTGAVLPREFDWDAVQRIGRIEEVWNAVCSGDLVSWLAGLAGGELGSSGAHGFAPNPRNVHSFPVSDVGCEHCRAARSAAGVEAAQALVHDVVMPDCQHSDFALGSAFALDQLLPMLLGVSAREYLQVRRIAVELSGEAGRTSAATLHDRAAVAAESIVGDWLGGLTLRERIREFGLKEREEVTAYRFFKEVADGVEAYEEHLRTTGPSQEALLARARKVDYRHVLGILAT